MIFIFLIFYLDLIRTINDPEHPLTLEQLKVTQHENIKIDDKSNYILVNFTPTIPHCSMATLIGKFPLNFVQIDFTYI